MNKYSFFLILFLCVFTFSGTQLYAQYDIPHGISYQAVAYNKDGKVVANSQVLITFTVYQGYMGGLINWQETHNATTNEFGMFNLVIGDGVSTGVGTASSFSSISWSSGKMFIRVQADFGDGMLDMGYTKMQSVPFAIIADSALRVPIPNLEDLKDANMRNLRVYETIKWNGKQWVPGDSLLTTFLTIDGDIIIGRNARILSDLFVNDTVTATTFEGYRAEVESLEVLFDARIDNNLDVKNDVKIGGGVLINKNLTVDQKVYILNDLFVTDSIVATTVKGTKADFANLNLYNDAAIGNSLYVIDSITATTVEASKGEFDNVQVNQDVNIDNDLDVGNSTRIGNNLKVQNKAWVNQDLYVSDSITATTVEASKGEFNNVQVNQDVNIDNDLDVGNSTTIGNNLTVQNKSWVNQDLYVSDSITATTVEATKGDVNDLEVDHDAWVKNDLQVDNNATIKQVLTNEDDIYALNDVYVTDTVKAATVDATNGRIANMLVTADEVVQGDLNVNGDVVFDKDLTVSGNQMVAGNIQAGGNLILSDTLATDVVNSGTGYFNNLHVAERYYGANDIQVGDSIIAATFKGTNGQFTSNLNIGQNIVIGNNLNVNGALTLYSGNTVNHITNDVYLSAGSSSALATEYAVKTYIGSVQSTLSGAISSTNTNLTSDLSTHISINDHPVIKDVTKGQASPNKALIVNGQKDIIDLGDVEIDGTLKLASGTSINEFSTDDNLGGNNSSDNVVPTEKSVKAYVDAGTTTASNSYLKKDGSTELTSDWNAGAGRKITARQFISTTTQIAPFAVSSTDWVDKLNVDEVDGKDADDFIWRDGSKGLSSDWDAGSHEIKTEKFESDVSTGTAPIKVASTTLVDKLNVDEVDGKDADDFVWRDGSKDLNDDWDAGTNQIRAETFYADVSTGTAPFSVVSNTVVNNLNADMVDGKDANEFVYRSGLTADLSMGNNKLTNLATPSSNSDATTKEYVDDLLAALWVKATNDIYYDVGGTTTEKVGINTNDPKSSLHVNGSFVLTGNSQTVDITGAGTRFMWLPAKKAIRAGSVTGPNWDIANVGNNSIAMGLNNKATNQASVALGDNTISSGAAAFAIGSSTEASGDYSFASGGGTNTEASGDYSFAHGNSITASGTSSAAMGATAVASGNNSFAFGSNATASGNNSYAFGSYVTASSANSYAFGENLVADKANLFAIGYYAATASNQLLVVGNGTSGTSGNALELFKNGNMTISGSLTENSDSNLKENIFPLPSVLSSLKNIQPVYYSFKDQTRFPEGRQIGLLAQEVAMFYPELVTRASNGYLGLNYSNFSAVLLQAIKEQQNLLEDMQSQITKQDQEILDLEQRLLYLEELLLNK
ncbi:tail fiber domain-containing protein [Bacteroidota bacterium]